MVKTSDVTSLAIGVDYYFISREGGRYGGVSSRDGQSAAQTSRDSYASQFIEYGILGRSTNSQAFDYVFERIASPEAIRGLDPESVQVLLELTDIYIQHHPDMEQNEKILGLKQLCGEFAESKA